MLMIELEEKEAQALRAMLDLAVRHGGMQVAAMCAALDSKIAQATLRMTLPGNGAAAEKAPPP